jgi:hypothetical protein
VFDAEDQEIPFVIWCDTETGVIKRFVHDGRSVMKKNGELVQKAAPVMLAALIRTHENIQRWLQTGEPASPDESRQIAEQIADAIETAVGGNEEVEDQSQKPVDGQIPTTMMLISNGQIICCDQNGQQIIELQSRSAIELWAEWAACNGFDVEGCEVRTQRPGGDGPRCIIEGDLGEFFERWVS